MLQVLRLCQYHTTSYDISTAQDKLQTAPAITMPIYMTRPEAVNQSGMSRTDQNNTAGNVCETGSDSPKHFCTALSVMPVFDCKQPAVAGFDE